MVEPWCTRLSIDCPQNVVSEYIRQEQPNTAIDLTKRVFSVSHTLKDYTSDVVITFDAAKMTRDRFMFITTIPQILDAQITEPGKFEHDIFDIDVREVRHLENDLIFSPSPYPERLE
ncbi:hypothetical protein LCGC14_2489740, partial [marine sediment metagenome]